MTPSAGNSGSASLTSRRRERSIRRFAAKIENPRAMWWECWTMPVPPSANHYRNGYARFGDRTVFDEIYAHRIVAAAVLGPIPDGHEVDHRCYTRNCVNPFHLRICTARDNKHFQWQDLGLPNPSVASDGGLARWTKRRRASDICINGHPWEGNTEFSSQGIRICTECKRISTWRYDAKRGRPYAIRKLRDLDQQEAAA